MVKYCKNISTLRAILLLVMVSLFASVISFTDRQQFAERIKNFISNASTYLSDERLFSERLYTATKISKIGDTYFIVDCWHHRIIYSRNLNTPISEWRTLDDRIAGPHSIVSDGDLYVAEDTGRHAIKVYNNKNEKDFQLSQVIRNVGFRPHRTIYDPKRMAFYVVGSGDQSLHIFKNRKGVLVRERQLVISELEGQYTRSITLRGDRLYFVGTGDIVVFRISGSDQPEFVFEFKIALAAQYVGSNDLFFFEDGGGILSSTPQKLTVFQEIDDLATGEAKDLSTFLKGTPYYVTVFDNSLFIPEITEYTRIVRYPMLDSNVVDFDEGSILFDFGPPNKSSIQRKRELPA